MTNRRDFLKGTAWMGATALAAGCMNTRLFSCGTEGAPMMKYADKKIPKLRIGIVGLGRGAGAARTFPKIPGCEVTWVCELPESMKRIELHRQWCAENGVKPPRFEFGAEAYKTMCNADDVDLVYNATPWHLHAPIGLYAMEHGKHVAIEVPAALTVDECWALVETSERTRRHCMQLENCCYGEIEMLAMNMCHSGVLGELVHGEGAYIHDLRQYCYGEYLDDEGPNADGPGYWNKWRLEYNRKHGGNQYQTHGLGPICIDMDINRGDQFDYLVSVDSAQVGMREFAKAKYGADSEKAKWDVKMGDMNTTIIRTKLGRTILVQHDVGTFRPYSRLNLISGTRGIVADYPFRAAIDERPNGKPTTVHSFNPEVSAQIREKYKHPLWRQAGELAKKVGGHGGMDFLMMLRLAYCLQNGQPLDMNVYDLATWCSIGELTERSADRRGASLDIPDFTRGDWRTTKRWGFEGVDLAKMGFKA